MKPSDIRAPYQSKGLTYGRKGMVATASKPATVEALRILMEGGNAFDAAIVAATVANVTMPALCQLGGDAFAVIYSAKTRNFWAMNGSGIGQNVTVDQMREKGYQKMPVFGPLSIGLPGAPDVYARLAALATFPLSRLLEPAIRYARDGFVVGAVEAHHIKVAEQKVLADEDCSAIFAPKGKVIKAGDILYQKDLAASFEHIAKYGFRSLYEGELAEAVTDDMILKGAAFEKKQF